MHFGKVALLAILFGITGFTSVATGADGTTVVGGITFQTKCLPNGNWPGGTPNCDTLKAIGECEQKHCVDNCVGCTSAGAKKNGSCSFKPVERVTCHPQGDVLKFDYGYAGNWVCKLATGTKALPADGVCPTPTPKPATPTPTPVTPPPTTSPMPTVSTIPTTLPTTFPQPPM